MKERKLYIGDIVEILSAVNETLNRKCTHVDYYKKYIGCELTITGLEETIKFKEYFTYWVKCNGSFRKISSNQVRLLRRKGCEDNYLEILETISEEINEKEN